MIDSTAFIHEKAIIEEGVSIGERTRVWAFSHIVSGVVVGDECNICDHTFIEGEVKLGDRVTIKSGVYLWDGIVLEDDVFIGPCVAFTNDFLVNNSVSKIMISGRTGFATRDYDNIIKVIPDVGGGIAGLAALLVNLPAGIGLWLFDKITGEQIDAASTRLYSVTGSWDKPKTVPIEN